MADVITFPSSSIVDLHFIEPVVDARRVIIDLEHEITELQYVIAEQALRLFVKVPSFEKLSQEWRVNAVILLFGLLASGIFLSPGGSMIADRASAVLKTSYPDATKCSLL